MQSNRRTDILHSPLFLVSLGILLLNDWFLKYYFHNWLTGKLSDIAGLAVVFLLAYSFFPKQAKTILVIVTVSFIFWKSPASQDFIELWNQLVPMTISRTIDYTDLLVLPILLLALIYAKRRQPRSTDKVWQYLIIFCSVFAITGTSKVTHTKEELQLLKKIEKVNKELVSTYIFKRQNIEPVIRMRIETLISTLPEHEKLKLQNIKAGSYRKDKFEAISYDFGMFYINTWVFHEQPDKLTEYYIIPYKKCDRQMALNHDKDVVAFLSAHITFHRKKNGVRMIMAKLELCDIPNRKSEKQAMNYFINNYIEKIENKFYLQ